jgi:hypothetical protein
MGDPLPCQHGGDARGLFGAFAAQAVFGDQRRRYVWFFTQQVKNPLRSAAVGERNAGWRR